MFRTAAFSTVLAIARKDANCSRPTRFFLTKDGDFLKKAGVRDELRAMGVELVEQPDPSTGASPRLQR